MPAAMDRIVLHVAQRVVHPAHVPLVGEAQAAVADRPADTPGQAVDSSAIVIAPGQRSRDHRVEVAQEADRLEVLAAAVDVGNPFALAAAVVAIEHRGHRIDAQPIDVKMLQPVERAGDQEALHFAAAEIVDEGVPVLMEALARVVVLVERGAVEARQAVRIGREMRRHPIEDDADAGAVAGIDEAAQSLRAGRSGAVGANRPSG